MLDEMGVKVWWPAAHSDGAAPAAAEAPRPPSAESRPTELRVATPAVPLRSVQPETAAPAASREPPRIQGAAVLAEAAFRIDGGTAEPHGGWLIVADMPPELDGRHAEPFAGDAGRLLGNMLRALRLVGGSMPVHLMRTHRGVPSGRPDSPISLDESLAAGVEAVKPCLVLAMGPLAAQGLLASGDPLGKLRGQVHRRRWGAGPEDLPVVVTYHPAYLLRNPADKAKAWSDLCLAAEQTPQSAEQG
ncbi:MAG: uracil-DNA glycosylase [Gammaproteobacteria bacterium]|nr:uracil-DNA glycosylase [Gammaproteobacteria bacterium]MBU1444478.1 uracil-DNA glycosylase [Gammaproteobacteria bacterium]MBU2286806.1 uracil-DNA glycosylase [Gammaproteobacteria bacterium]